VKVIWRSFSVRPNFPVEEVLVVGAKRRSDALPLEVGNALDALVGEDGIAETGILVDGDDRKGKALGAGDERRCRPHCSRVDRSARHRGDLRGAAVEQPQRQIDTRLLEPALLVGHVEEPLGDRRLVAEPDRRLLDPPSAAVIATRGDERRERPGCEQSDTGATASAQDGASREAGMSCHPAASPGS
jgi:hypothetical protein